MNRIRNKSKNDSKNNKVDELSKLSTVTLKSIISYTILGITILIVLVNTVVSIADSIKHRRLDDKDRLWVEAYKMVESSKVGVDFKNINTTDSEYTKLRFACNEYIDGDKLLSSEYIDAKLNITTKINEETFIDGVVDSDIHVTNIKDNSGDGQGMMVETGPLYFQDMILIRYINNEGELKIITALYDDIDSGAGSGVGGVDEGVGSNGSDGRKIVTLRQSELVDYIKSSNWGRHGHGYICDENLHENNSNIESDGNDGVDELINEEDYLRDIGDIIVKAITVNTLKEMDTIENMAIKYFTIEGRKVISSNSLMKKIDNESNISVNYIIAGKSDNNKTDKDRVYLQLKVSKDTLNQKDDMDNILINIIVKLNKNFKVFDIDVI